MNQQVGARWLQKFGEREVITICNQHASVPTVKGLRVPIFRDQLVSGPVMVKELSAGGAKCSKYLRVRQPSHSVTKELVNDMQHSHINLKA